MRDLADIDSDINRLALELANVRHERVEHQRIWRQRFIDVFDEGLLSIAEIAQQTGTRFSIVQGILYRAGRTEGGRALVHEQIAQAVRPAGHQVGGST